MHRVQGELGLVSLVRIKFDAKQGPDYVLGWLYVARYSGT